MPETHDFPQLLTTREAAAIAKVHVSTVNKWVRRGSLPAVQREPRTLIDREGLEQFLQQRKSPTQAASPEHDALTDDADGTSRLLTTHEAAAIAGVRARRVEKWVARGRLRAVHRRPRILIDPEDLEQFLQQRRPPTQAASPEYEVATGTAPQNDKPEDLAQEMSEEADEERQAEERVQAPVRLLIVQEAADIAKVHPRTVHKWVASRNLRIVQREPHILIDPKVLEQLLRNRTRLAQAASTEHEPLTDDAGEASRLLTAKQAAATAQVHVSTLRKWVRQGNLQAVQHEPQIMIDPEALDQFLSQRTPPAQAVSPEPESIMDDAGAPAQGDLALLDVLPMPAADTPNDAMWRALVLVLQRELEATKARELRLLDLLDQATKPPPPPPRRRIVSEMTVVYRIKAHLEAVGRPQRAWQIQKALKLDKTPYRDLSRLVARGEIQRVSEGVYAAID